MSFQLTYRIIKSDKWYIVDTMRYRNGKPRMLKREFNNKHIIQYNINRLSKLHGIDKLRFCPIKGKKAIELGLTITNKNITLGDYFYRYRYDGFETFQQKKSYRTKFRRQNRIIGTYRDSTGRKCNVSGKGEYVNRWG